MTPPAAPLEISAKQKPNHVVVDVTRTVSAEENRVDTLPAAAEPPKAKFVNNLLYDLDS